jgi:hypothetical protein
MQSLRHQNSSGVTLVEVLIAAAVFLIAVVGILNCYIKFLELVEIGRGTTVALQTMKGKLVDIKGADFFDIHTTYNNTTFIVPGLNGIGVVYVDDSNAKLLTVKVTYCWRLITGRLIGEDRNLNGVLDNGEDKNGNGQIDSEVQIVTQIYG